MQFSSSMMIRPTLPAKRLPVLYWLPLLLLLISLWGEALAIETTEQVLRPPRPTNDILSPYERFWLREHPQLRLAANTHWPPFESVDESGRYQGMVMDYLELIQQRIGYQFQLVFRDTWSQTLRALEEREVDALPAISITPLREEQMLFSEQYISFPIVLAVRDDMPFIGGLDELDNERVGVVRGYAPQDFLLMSHPHLNLVLVDTLEEGLLKVSNGELDVLVSNIPSISHLVNRLGIGNIKITGITPYTDELHFGIRPDMPELRSIINKALATITQEEHDAIYKKWISRSTVTDTDYSLVWRVVAVAAVVVVIFLYWNRKLSREVTERMRSEEALRQSEEKLRAAMLEAEHLAQAAEAANKTKSEFLANMSHEIRTPMNAVLGYTELLEVMITDEKQKSYLESIKKGGRALLTIINDILDLSRIESGKLKMEYAPVDPRRLLRDVEQIFSARAAQKKLDFRLLIPDDLPRALVLDEIRLRQVLFNLVGNAIKFTHEGYISLSARALPPRQNISGRIDLVLSVEDTGIGIPRDQQARIFHAFEQQEGQSNRLYGGTGLGLAISKKLIEMMNGEIRLQSEAGEGSRFDVHLFDVALGKTIDEPVDPPKKRQYRFKPARILIVDDTEVNRDLLRENFANQPFELVMAENGQQALQKTRDDLPDLILLDIRMPVMDGFTTIQQLRSQPDTQAIPVIALTASNLAQDLDKIRAAGFDGYLHKPVSRGELLATVAQFLPQEPKTKAKAKAKPAATKAAPAPEPETHGESWQQVLGLLQGEMQEEWAELQDSGDLERIQSFAQKLSQLAEQARAEELAGYAALLEQQVSQFDLSGLQENLTQYPALVQQWGEKAAAAQS